MTRRFTQPADYGKFGNSRSSKDPYELSKTDFSKLVIQGSGNSMASNTLFQLPSGSGITTRIAGFIILLQRWITR